MKKLNRMLVVDDDALLLDITEYILHEHNKEMNIATAANGKEAVSYLEHHKDVKDLIILLDINMPLMNGYEFLDWFQGSAFRGECKIFMYSTSSREKDQKRSLAYEDVLGYIEKPLDESKIQNMQKILEEGKKISG